MIVFKPLIGLNQILWAPLLLSTIRTSRSWRINKVVLDHSISFACEGSTHLHLFCSRRRCAVEPPIGFQLYRVIVNECYKNKQVTCNKYKQFFVVTCLDLLSMSGHSSLLKTKTMCGCMYVWMFVSSLWRLITEKWRELGW